MTRQFSHDASARPSRSAPAELRVAANAPRGSNPKSKIQNPKSPRRALTLIEMLVSLAVTLVMMAAVVNLFANMSASVRNRRAGIELGGQLRQVRQQLARDLAGATCPAVPWQKAEDAVGYIEIIEGGWSDKNPSALTDDPYDNVTGDAEINYGTSLIPSSQLLNPTSGNTTDGRALGDYDDVLALTVRSEGKPFVGRTSQWVDKDNDGAVDPDEWIATTIESNVAEVIWYAVETPVDDPSTNNIDESRGGEPGMRRLYRRVLLIAPWVDLSAFNRNFAVGAATAAQLNDFYRKFDVSAKIEGGQVRPNTLSDLTKRENRFAHILNPLGNGLSIFPHEMDLHAIRLQRELSPGSPGTQTGFPTGSGSALHPFGEPFEVAPVQDRLGEDFMVGDMLAFDVRVYDPGAPLYANSGNLVEPSDPGWFAAITNTPAGFGSYVDLGWGWNSTLATPQMVYAPNNPPPLTPIPTGMSANIPTPLFNFTRRVGWQPRLDPGYLGSFVGYPCVYDTWSFHYENDGLNQDQLSGLTPGAATWQTGVVDQGTNGIDDDNANGVDDMGERETMPPYNAPLRGVKIILRSYERDSRQIRETSVTHSFVP